MSTLELSLRLLDASHRRLSGSTVVPSLGSADTDTSTGRRHAANDTGQISATPPPMLRDVLTSLLSLLQRMQDPASEEESTLRCGTRKEIEAYLEFLERPPPGLIVAAGSPASTPRPLFTPTATDVSVEAAMNGAKRHAHAARCSMCVRCYLRSLA